MAKSEREKYPKKWLSICLIAQIFFFFFKKSVCVGGFSREEAALTIGGMCHYGDHVNACLVL